MCVSVNLCYKWSLIDIKPDVTKLLSSRGPLHTLQVLCTLP